MSRTIREARELENETRGWQWEIRNRNDLLYQVNKPKPYSG